MTGWAVMHGTIACCKELFSLPSGYSDPRSGIPDRSALCGIHHRKAPRHHSYCLGCDLRSYVHEPPLGKAEDAEEALLFALKHLSFVITVEIDDESQ
jgi:hypothetical protein